MSTANQFTNTQIDLISATIASGETTSTAIKIYGCTAAALYIPASFTGSTVTFQASADKGENFANLYGPLGVQASLSVVTNAWHTLDPQVFFPYDQIKVVGSAQGADRTILVKPFNM